MTRDEGYRLLNRLLEGQDFFYEQITAALIATGDAAGWYDLDGSLAAGMRSQGMGQPDPMPLFDDWDGGIPYKGGKS